MTNVYVAGAGVRSDLPATDVARPDPWLLDLFAGEEAGSGIRVGRESSLRVSAWWRGVNLIARDVGKLPLNVLKRSDGRGKEKAKEHKAYRLLRRQPNPWQTHLTFKMLLTFHSLHVGNGYAYIFRDGAGRPKELIPLDPTQTDPVREAGELYYATRVNGQLRKLLPDNVLHIKGLSFDGLVGYSVYQKAKEALGLKLGAERHGSRFFANNAAPNVALETPKTWDAKKRNEFRAEWAKAQQGLDNAYRAAVLPGEVVLKTYTSVSARDAQALELQQFSLREIANFLGVPPHKVGDTTRTAFASLEQENQSYLDEGLDFWLCNWESECDAKLLTEDEQERETHLCEFNRLALARADMAARAEFYSKGIVGGWFSPDDVRDRENMAPMPDGLGGRFVVPLNMEDAATPVKGGTFANLYKLAIDAQAGTVDVDVARELAAFAYTKMKPAQAEALFAALQKAADAKADETTALPPPPQPMPGDPIPPPPPIDDEHAKRSAAAAIAGETIRRMTRRVATHLARAGVDVASKAPAIIEEHAATVRESLRPVNVLLAPSRALAAPDDLADLVLTAIHQRAIAGGPAAFTGDAALAALAEGVVNAVLAIRGE